MFSSNNSSYGTGFFFPNPAPAPATAQQQQQEQQQQQHQYQQHQQAGDNTIENGGNNSNNSGNANNSGNNMMMNGGGSYGFNGLYNLNNANCGGNTNFNNGLNASNNINCNSSINGNNDSMQMMNRANYGMGGNNMGGGNMGMMSPNLEGGSNNGNGMNMNSQIMNSGMMSPSLGNGNNFNNYNSNVNTNSNMTSNNNNNNFNGNQNTMFNTRGDSSNNANGNQGMGNGNNFNAIQFNSMQGNSGISNNNNGMMFNGSGNQNGMMNSTNNNMMMNNSGNSMRNSNAMACNNSNNNNSNNSNFMMTNNNMAGNNNNGIANNGNMMNSNSNTNSNNMMINNSNNTSTNNNTATNNSNIMINANSANNNTPTANGNTGIFGNFSFANSFFNPFNGFGFSSSNSNNTDNNVSMQMMQNSNNSYTPIMSPVPQGMNSNMMGNARSNNNAGMNIDNNTSNMNNINLSMNSNLSNMNSNNNGSNNNSNAMVNSTINSITPKSPSMSKNFNSIISNDISNDNTANFNVNSSNTDRMQKKSTAPHMSLTSTSPSLRYGPTPEPMTFMTPPMGPTPVPQFQSPITNNFSLDSPQEQFQESGQTNANSNSAASGAATKNTVVNTTGTATTAASPFETNTPNGIAIFNNVKNAAAKEEQQIAPAASIAKSTKTTKSRKRAASATAAAMPKDQAAALASQSFFRRGITSVGSALGVVANYINESFLSGIPFHIADRAMKESKETYAKWWEGGINDSNEDGDNGDGFRGGRMENDDDMEKDGDSVRPDKRRKLDHTTFRRSSLSDSLQKNYKDMGIDVNKNASVMSNDLPNHGLIVSGMADVDDSIIKPRRSKFQKRFSHQESSGYDIFNNIGSMYGHDMYGSGENASHAENASVASEDKESKPASAPSARGSMRLSTEFGSYGSLYEYCQDGKDGKGVKDDKDNTDTDSPPSEEAADDDGAPKSSAKVTVKKNATVITSTNTLDGTLNAIRDLLEEKNRASEEKEVFEMISSPREWITRTIRSELIEALQSVRGDVKDKRFLSCLEILARFYKASGRDARVNPWSGSREGDDETGYGYYGGDVGGPTSSDLLEGSWLNMSRPNYVECLGNNAEGDFMYTLGRMSFDMFQPGTLICSVQSTHNTIKIVGEREELPTSVPSSLKEEVTRMCDSNGDSTAKRPLLRSYDIAVSMTIEPPSSVGQPEPQGVQSPTTRMRAVMSVKGYVLPDPKVPNRLTVWFIGGKLSPARLSSGDGGDTDDEDETECEDGNKVEDGYGSFDDWTAVFAKGKWRKTLAERARAMAAKLLLGADVPNKMEEDGHMEYFMHRPVGGHGKVYVDVLYLDEDILIMRGHHGTIYAMSRSGVSQRYKRLRGRRTSNNE